MYSPRPDPVTGTRTNRRLLRTDDLKARVNPDPSLSDPNYSRGNWKWRAEDDELDSQGASSSRDMTDDSTLKAISYRPSTFSNLPKLVNVCQTLLLSFTETLNYCHHIVDPTRLMEDFSIYTEHVRWGRPLNSAVVCLMLRVCACVLPCLPSDLRCNIEDDLQMPVQSLADQCHRAAVDLSEKIPVGETGLLQVQQLLLTSYWHSFQGDFHECWRALGAAIREAGEIGLNTESQAGGLSELDSDLRRRIWCILDIWDWHISTLFSRPQLINRRNCDVISPNLRLEPAPHPIHEMALQYQIIQTIDRKFGNINQSLKAADAREFQNTIHKWTGSFPTMFHITNPDTSMDEGHPWIAVQRQYLHVMAYTMILVPLRIYMSRAFDPANSQEEQRMRASGVDYCLKLRDAHMLLFHSTYPFCAKYHLAQFSLVDLGVTLCFTIMNDERQNLPKRDQVITVIGDVLQMLKHTQDAAGRPSLSYKTISKLVRRLPISQDEMQIIRCRAITVESDESSQIAAKSAQTSPQPTVVPAHETAAQDQPDMDIPMDSFDGPPTPVSIDAEPTSYKPVSSLERHDTALSNIHAELTPPLESANSNLLTIPGSHASIDTLGREQDSCDHHRLGCPVHMSTRPILEVFVERFLDSYGPEMPSAWQPLHWIHDGQPYQIWRVGAKARHTFPLLSNAFAAVSVAQFGRSISDWRLITSADTIYLSVLRSLQVAISQPERSRSDDVLMATILCAVYEGVSRTRPNGFLIHLLGILKLLEFRGARGHATGIAHGLFAELRCYFVFAAVTTRSPTFLAQPEWKHVPWSSAESSPKDMFQHLLDIMVELPALLSYADQINAYSGAKSAAEIGRLQQQLWTLGATVEQHLYQWKQEKADRYPGGKPRELDVKVEDALSFFPCRDQTTGEVGYATTFVYPDPVLAQAMCHYYAALILVFSADTRRRETERPDIYGLACSICRIMGYFARTVPSGLASRVAYPFRLAYDCLPDGGMEREYVDEAFRWIARRRFSHEWGSNLDGVSIRE
ncbi:hypothetical protein NLG97_g2352 [Lecanicillium saksenae]|uniref:Uncharacterized protein n=1 Tax=Lecanicillium saksenae TaxID=468837 RepID=A0ACC1R1E2_9HYPO|nr:hypothetical protein NLG97_g2352 [Lecanicillium saksenae]